MDELSEITKPVPKHSMLGIASVIIGSINIVIFIYFFYQLVQWLLLNPSLLENPGKISGTHVPDNVMTLIYFFIGLQVTGCVLGLLGLFGKNKKKFLPIIGIIINGLFLLFSLSKVL